MRNRRGFALIAALWLLVALSVVGLEFSLAARQQRLAAANLLEDARGRAAAEAGLAHALARLTALARDAESLRGAADPRLLADPWAAAPGLVPDTVALGKARYHLTLRDANGALNVNRAGEDELRNLMAALRVDYGRADEIAQSIMDWRDEDDFHRGRGAERDYYLRRGSPVLPRNGPLHDLDELLHVRGMTPEIHARVLPYLTLVGSGRVNLNSADPVVLLALPGMTDEAVAVITRHRRQGRRLGNLFELSQQLSPGARAAFDAHLPQLLARTTMETREVELRGMGWDEGSPVRVSVHALVVRAGGNAFTVWRQLE
jgi:general secretion pathway protein K